MAGSRTRTRNGRGPDDVSELDKRIIEHLQQDGRRPFTQIAAELGVCEAAVRARTNRLVERGILQIVGVTDPLKLGFQQLAMIGIRCERDRLIDVAEAVRLPGGRLRRHHRRHLRHPHRGRLRGQRGAPQLPVRAPAGDRGRPRHRDLRLPADGQADLSVGDALTGCHLTRSRPRNIRERGGADHDQDRGTCRSSVSSSGGLSRPSRSILLLLVAIAINLLLVAADGSSAVRRRLGDRFEVRTDLAEASTDRPRGRLLLGRDGPPVATYDRVVRVAGWALILTVSAVVALSGLWPDTRPAIFVLMALAGLFLLVIHELLPDEFLGPARPIVEGSRRDHDRHAPDRADRADRRARSSSRSRSSSPGRRSSLRRGSRCVLAIGAGSPTSSAVLIRPPRLPLDVPAAAAIALNLAALLLLAFVPWSSPASSGTRASRRSACRPSTRSRRSSTGRTSSPRSTARSSAAPAAGRGVLHAHDGPRRAQAVNDRFGHFHGDRVLRDVAETIRHRVRRIDTAARYGGDEFVVLLPETDPTGAFVLAEKIRSGVGERVVEADGLDVRASLSIGVVVYPGRRPDGDDLMIAADQAMYALEASGHEPHRRLIGRSAAARRRRSGPAQPTWPTRRGPRR